MKTFDQIITERNELLDKVDGILNAANGLLSEEQQKEVEGYQQQAEDLKNEADKLQAAAAKAVELQQKQSQLRAVRLNPIVNRIVRNGGNAPSTLNDSTPFRLPANVRRYEPTNFQQTEVDGRSRDERAYRFGMWALATASAQLPGSYRFGNAVDFCFDQGLMNVHGEGGGDVSGAGVFVPNEFMFDIIRLVETYGVGRQVFNVVQMSSDTLTKPRRVGGLTAYAVGESVAGTESDAEWNEVRLLARKFMVLTRMSSELSEDAVVNFANELVREIAYAFAVKEDDCVFNGTGASTYNGIVGVRTKLATLTAGTAPGLISGAGSAWSNLTLANFNSVVANLPQYAAMGSPAWYCSRPFYYSVMEPLLQAANGAVFELIQGGSGLPRFLGYPVRITQSFPTATASGHIPVVLGDLNMGCLFGDRRAMSLAYTTEASIGGQSLFERDQVGIKATERFDFVCHDFGTNSVAGPICGIKTQ